MDNREKRKYFKFFIAFPNLEILMVQEILYD